MHDFVGLYRDKLADEQQRSVQVRYVFKNIDEYLLGLLKYTPGLQR